jgi:hypothetical protein
MHNPGREGGDEKLISVSEIGIFKYARNKVGRSIIGVIMNFLKREDWRCWNEE